MMDAEQRRSRLDSLKTEIGDAMNHVIAAQLWAAMVASDVGEWAVEQELVRMQQDLQRIHASVISMDQSDIGSDEVRIGDRIYSRKAFSEAMKNYSGNPIEMDHPSNDKGEAE